LYVCAPAIAVRLSITFSCVCLFFETPPIETPPVPKMFSEYRLPSGTEFTPSACATVIGCAPPIVFRLFVPFRSLSV